MQTPVIVKVSADDDAYVVVHRREYWRLAPDNVDPDLWAAVVAKLQRRASLDQEAMLEDNPDGWRVALVAHKGRLDALMSRMKGERIGGMSATTGPASEAARLELAAAWAAEKGHANEWAGRVQGHLTMVKGILRKRDGDAAPGFPKPESDALWSHIRALEARVQALTDRVGE